MKLSEYSDEDLLEEVKHRGFEIKLISWLVNNQKISIGGIVFELRT